jgi:hypothetical protein
MSEVYPHHHVTSTKCPNATRDAALQFHCSPRVVHSHHERPVSLGNLSASTQVACSPAALRAGGRVYQAGKQASRHAERQATAEAGQTIERLPSETQHSTAWNWAGAVNHAGAGKRKVREERERQGERSI